MPLTQEELGRLDAARNNSMVHRLTKDKRVLQLAFEHIEHIEPLLIHSRKVIEALVAERNATLCYRVRSAWQRVRRLWAK
jgi:hypothetical protein